MAAGLGFRTMLGFHYATNSALAPAYPNEWEFWARHQLLSQDAGAPVDLGGMVGYNLAAEGVDGEVSLARRFGPVRLIGAGRVLSDAVDAGETRFALAGGGTLRLNRFFAVGGCGSDSSDRGQLTRVAIARCATIHGHPVSPARVLVVGDTPRDIEAAHAAGAIGVGVATGKYSVDELRAAGADHVVATLETPLPGVAEELARLLANSG